ncbi:MAG: hypothetical protein B6U95_08150 [Thermofilum sp. ex4484_82]|nr:MAG: hypothetical protein B6U95_08150 [Thermofilum sp. ex4484_82]OYT36636.1 MAG: hypothetical protein B6U96_08150 [Archaeoglobales archaeon ex4484_92]
MLPSFLRVQYTLAWLIQELERLEKQLSWKLREAFKPHVQKDQIEGEIIYIDGFGNIVTNIYSEILEKVGISEEDKIKILLNDKLEKVLKICKAYNEVKKGEFLAIIGSGNFLEISINQGNAAKKLNVKEGAKIKIKLT